ncbi:MAG: AarF/UbiB family protein [Acidobacteriota bacterium]
MLIPPALGLILFSTWASTVKAEISLPTPLSHYEKFKRGTTGLILLSQIADEADPAVRQVLSQLGATLLGLPKDFSIPDLDTEDRQKLLSLIREIEFPKAVAVPKAQTLALLQKVNWHPWRQQLLELFIHQSQVLDMIPLKWGNRWTPIVHDALLFFLDHLPEDRLTEKLVNMAYLPPDSPRGAYLLEFVARTPSLQKLGQILARNQDLESDFKQALQQLENSIQTMPRDELLQFVKDEVGRSQLDQYQVQFADRILAEASVGAVIRATYTPAPSAPAREAICKVIKPYVLTHLPQELRIIDGLARYFTEQHQFYGLGNIPLSEMFRDIEQALTNEIKIVDEQRNLVRAHQYYQNNRRILIPELLPLSTEHVTFMEFVHGEKIANAFPGDTRHRSILARRLLDVMTFEVIFARQAQALFHGDPHSGNVFRVNNDPRDPYRIALLDWGLCGDFNRKERLALVQLLLGVRLGDAKRLRNHVGMLLQHGLPDTPERLPRIQKIIDQVIRTRNRRSSFDALGELLTTLVQEGHATKFNLNTFIKSQITIAGILSELDPELNQDQYIERRVRGLVLKELPKRLLFTLWVPGWKSRNYPSMLSNQDVLSQFFKRRKGPPSSQEATTTPGLSAERPAPQELN